MVAWPGVKSAGIGVPGLYDPATGTTRFLVNVSGEWAGKPVAGPVAAALGAPVHLVNDARAFGLAELRLGAGRGVSSMIGFTLGTGVGGVFAIDGRVHQGHDGTGGELGHQTIDPDGPWCGCGSRGCVEAFARADQIAAACGAASVEDAVARARAGDPVAVAGFADVGRYLGIGIANAIVVINPERVVIGGGVAACLDLMVESIERELERRVRVTSLEAVEVVAAELGVWAGAIGAALHGADKVAADAESAGQLMSRAT
jgi:glucokinase